MDNRTGVGVDGVFKRVLRAKKRSFRSMLILGMVASAVVAFVAWVFVAIDPFQPINPFLHEATIGESVIGDWRYGGTSSDGQMKFYDAYQYIDIPANSVKFAADGVFVRIDGHTPSTLTYEPAYESELIGPATYVWILLALGAVFFSLWKKKSVESKRMKQRRGHFSGMRR